jgi:hypothetical protein
MEEVEKIDTGKDRGRCFYCLFTQLLRALLSEFIHLPTAPRDPLVASTVIKDRCS